MQFTTKADATTRSWFGFLTAVITVCIAFGMLGFVSSLAFAAPDSSSSASTDVSASSAAAEDVAESADNPPIDVSLSVPENVLESLAMGNDILVSGDSAIAADKKVKANLFASGSTVEVSSTNVGADAFVAGNEITISNLTTGSNLFVAGNNVTISGTTGLTCFAAGNNLDIAADMHDLYATGRTVYLKGTFEGNVEVSAQTVVIDPYIVVKGTLNVSAETEPTIASTAKIGSYNYTQAEFNTGLDINSGFANIGSPEWIKDLVYALLTLLVTAIVMLLLVRTEVIDATGLLVRNRPVAILITGLLSLILIPAISIGLFISIVGWQVATVFTCICFAMSVLAVVYTAVALGRAALIRVNKWVTTILFVGIFGLLMSLPVVDFIVVVLSIIFTTGSLVQGWWVWRRGKELDGGSHDDGSMDDYTIPRGTHYAPEGAYAATARPLTPSQIAQDTGSQTAVPPTYTPQQ